MDDACEGSETAYGFGSFQLEPQERRLVCGDMTVALGPKLFDLLWLLAREQGRVVPRDRITEALWPDVVVSETNLRQKVWLLRRLLRAADPGGGEYVETVPRRGYRLAALVTCVPAALSPHLAGPEEPADPPAPASGERRERRPPRRAFLHPAATAVPLLLAVLVSSSSYRPAVTVTGENVVPTAPAPRRSVTVLRLMSHSDGDQDGWLAAAFTEMLRAELAASSRLRLIPVETVERMAAKLSPPPGVGLSADSLGWVGNALGSDVVVAGSLVAAGPGPDAHLRVDLLVQCTRTREVLAAVTRSGLRREMPQLASVTARELRRTLGVVGSGRPAQ